MPGAAETEVVTRALEDCPPALRELEDVAGRLLTAVETGVGQLDARQMLGTVIAGRGALTHDLLEHRAGVRSVTRELGRDPECALQLELRVAAVPEQRDCAC